MIFHSGFFYCSESDDWIIYRRKSSPRPVWSQGEMQARPFGRTSDGFPDFDTPLICGFGVNAPALAGHLTETLPVPQMRP
jgi:hypothetical protein